MSIYLSRRVRLKGTHITGYVYTKHVEAGETLYLVIWDDMPGEDTRHYRADELESAEKIASYLSIRYYSFVELDRHRIEEEGEKARAEGTNWSPKRRVGHKRA